MGVTLGVCDAVTVGMESAVGVGADVPAGAGVNATDEVGAGFDRHATANGSSADMAQHDTPCPTMACLTLTSPEFRMCA